MIKLEKETIFQTRDTEKIWQRFCGFLDLTVDEFMDIQRRLLEEQLELVGDSPLWKKILNGKKPKTLEEFREIVPLTAYWTHYAEYIGEEDKDQFLTSKPLLWAHTSGRGGQFKWIPWTKTALERYADAMMAGMILSCAARKGEVKIQDGCRTLAIMAPLPYLSGISTRVQASRFDARIIPPIDVSEKLEFQERIKLGFKIALNDGIDVIGGVSTVLVKAGESMEERSGGVPFSLYLLRPSVLLRMLRAYVKSKRGKRSVLPKDLWTVKGILCGGTDTSIYREKLKYYWGREAHEVYALTECSVVSVQSWTRQYMTFYPYCTFMEFIPEEDWLKSRQDNKFQPRTVLLNEMEVGKIYEVVLSNFYGMPLMRYRPGDLIKVTALADKETGIKLPQAIFYSRADFLIDLYSIVRLDERTIWQAIDDTHVKYEDWSARKEYIGSKPILQIYIELKENSDAKTMEKLIHEQLIKGCPFYKEAIEEMQTNPVQVTLLQPGSFQRYYDKKRAEGADLAQLKPPHMNAIDVAIRDLLGDKKQV